MGKILEMDLLPKLTQEEWKIWIDIQQVKKLNW